jgi:lipoprotein-anchoring transpeptidase ErfK/SrfK
MTHQFHFVLLFSSIIIAFGFVLIPTAASAGDHVAVPGAEHAIAATPPLPEVSPQLAPPLTYGYHQETEFPTTTEKWIDVDLSEQRVVAYEGAKPVRAFIVSTGLPGTPTETGEFRIRMKVRSQTMSGPGYYLPNVEWVQYFYDEYAFHGTYWHDNFGQPMSRGCVNMTDEDAKWLFDWAGPPFGHDGPTWQRSNEVHPGTIVVVHE